MLFEKSDTTLDGVHRGNFGRPIAYIFILDNEILPKVKTFVNQDMIDNGKAVRSEYNVDFPVLFTENFDLSSMRVSAWVKCEYRKGKCKYNRASNNNLGRIKEIKPYMVISEIRSLYQDENDLLRTVTKRIYEQWDAELEQWHLKKVEYIFADPEFPVPSDNIEVSCRNSARLAHSAGVGVYH